MSARIPVDIGRLVGLVGGGAWALLAFFAVTTATIALASAPEGEVPWPVIIALILTWGAGALLAAVSPTPLQWWRVVAVYAVILIDIILCSPDLPLSGDPGYRIWYLGSTNFLLFAVALRARIVAAWIGMVILVGAHLTWSVMATGSVVQGILTCYGQPVSLLAGTVFSFGLHRAARRIADFQAAEERQASENSFGTEQISHRQQSVARLRARVEPILQVIASGGRAGSDRLEARLLEASLRDEIRGGRLAVAPLVDAVRHLRRDGAEVLVLDDAPAGGDYAVAAQGLAQWAASVISTAGAPEVTVRMVGDDETVTVTVTADGVDESRSAPVAG